MVVTTRNAWSSAIVLAIFAVSGCGAHSSITPSLANSAPRDDAKSSHHETFNYNGKVQVFVVPAHVSSISVDVRGAAGSARTTDGHYSGLGGRIVALIPVRPHEELYVFVGGKGSRTAGGFNGGGSPGPGGGSNGGGGASDIRNGLNVRHRLIVGAGGGGEGSYESESGGSGGGKTGMPGSSYCDSDTSSCDGNGGGGGGGTQTAGGSGGTAGGATSGSAPGGPGTSGALGIGGNGGAAGCGYTSGTCRCGYSNGCPGAGGGGGYYGGGGGGGGAGTFGSLYGGLGAGGGGGSSWVEARAANVKTWTGWANAVDNGLVIIRW